MCPHILDLQPQPRSPEPMSKHPQASTEYLDGALVIAGASAAESESSSQTAPGASAPLSKPALDTAPRDEEGPLVSEADPTSNAG